MRFLVLAHVDGDEVALTAIQDVGQRQRGLGLAHPARPHEQEHALGLVRIFQPGTRGAHPLRDRRQRVVLPDHPLLQGRLQIANGLDLVLHHLAQRDTRPGRDDLGHHMAIHLHRHQRGFALQGRQLGLLGREQLVIGAGKHRQAGFLAALARGSSCSGRRCLALQRIARDDNARRPHGVTVGLRPGLRALLRLGH